MSSRTRSSRKKSSSHSSSDDSPDVVVPKGEYVVEDDMREAYYRALCESMSPPESVPFPLRPSMEFTAPFSLSAVSVDYLTNLRDFYQVPSGVMFWIPSGDENAMNPLEGFFTCYEVFLTYCRMWFPILGTIVRALHRFELSISQLTIPSLESWLGVLILSYELGMDLSPGDFEGFWITRKRSGGLYSMVLKTDMAVIQGNTLNPKFWSDPFFYVRIDGESVEESCLHLFRKEWKLDRGNTTGFVFRFDSLKVCDDKFFFIIMQ